jgi:hypothetical protein
MASQAYRDWVKDGKPVKYGRAIDAVGDGLRAHGYTVYAIGNEAHLTHEPPEDHTPFSATGWPGKSPYPYVLAIDIMPPAAGQRSKITGKPLPSLQRLSAQLIKDKDARHPGAAFLKYMNAEPEKDNGGPCYHHSWTPTYARRPSSDRGHIHLSSRTDYATSTASNGYDLVARVMGDDDDMNAAELDAYYKSRASAKDGTPEAAVRNAMRAIGWQYVGGGIPAGMSTLNVLNAIHSYSKATAELVKIIASSDDVDEAELARQIADAVSPVVVALAVPQIVAVLEEGGATHLTAAEIEAAVSDGVRHVLREGVDDAAE